MAAGGCHLGLALVLVAAVAHILGVGLLVRVGTHHKGGDNWLSSDAGANRELLLEHIIIGKLVSFIIFL